MTMPVEVADDQAKREYGLMNRNSLPGNAGMIFVFQPVADTTIGFWMKDTLLPLSVAFVERNPGHRKHPGDGAPDARRPCGAQALTSMPSKRIRATTPPTTSPSAIR